VGLARFGEHGARGDYFGLSPSCFGGNYDSLHFDSRNSSKQPLAHFVCKILVRRNAMQASSIYFGLIFVLAMVSGLALLDYAADWNIYHYFKANVIFPVLFYGYSRWQDYKNLRCLVCRRRKHPLDYTQWAINVPVPDPIGDEPEFVTLCQKHRREVFDQIVIDRLIDQSKERYYGESRKALGEKFGVRDLPN
jgi:hypothetical protein